MTASRIILCSVITLIVSSANAQTSAEAQSTAIDSGKLRPAADFKSVEACWSAWLKTEGLNEGKNERGSYFVLVSHEKAAVNETPGSDNWLAARNAVFQIVELQSRKTLAETMRVMIQSDRSTSARQLGGDDAPSSLRVVADQLSLVEKSQVLADKAIDAEIKKYDQRWSGSPAARADKVATLQQKLSENITSSTALFASGAFTAVQCEGPSDEDDGKYSVLVGLIWSPNLQKIAEAIWNPATQIPPAPPGLALKEQFSNLKNESPDWLAYTMGARVFTDEKGNRVVVGFGVAPKTSLMNVDRDRARLAASSAIQRFLGEKLVANSEEHKRFEERGYKDGSSTSFDTSGFSSRIDSVSKDFPLVGATEVTSWRGEHPWSKAGMQVVALAWSQAWAKDSKMISDAMIIFEKQLQRQGVVPVPIAGPVPKKTIDAGAATSAKPGARSSTRDF